MEASLDVHERHLEEAEFKEKIKMEWQHAALVIDRWATSRTSNTLCGSQAAPVDLHSGDHLGHLWDPLHVPTHTTLHPLSIRSFGKDVWNSIWFDWNDLHMYIQFDWNTITHFNSILHTMYIQLIFKTNNKHFNYYSVLNE